MRNVLSQLSRAGCLSETRGEIHGSGWSCQWRRTQSVERNLQARLPEAHRGSGCARSRRDRPAACGSSSSGTTTTATTATTLPSNKIPKGGVLNAALTGGDSSDTVDGQKGVNNVDFARIVSLYDAAVVWDLNCQPRYTLAESIEPNKAATVWTIKLRKDVTFHNGKSLTAQDVIYSYQRVVSGNLGGASSLASCDVKNMKALDDLTVQIPCHVPFVMFVASIIGYYYYLSILPVGFDPKKPVGTGPFVYESFTPGERSVFNRNPNYWDSPYPYVDSVVITDFQDETSQVNALVSGQADCVNLLSVDSINTVHNGGANVLVSKAAGMTPVTMRVDSAPFNDARVRQALRLCVDREQMLKLVFGGNGRIGNDIFSPLSADYDTSIPQRVQDIDQAKSLLKKAGQENLTVTMQTADIAQGTSAMAQVLKQQASLAGITINLQPVTVTEFYGTNYLKWTFAERRPVLRRLPASGIRGDAAQLAVQRDPLASPDPPKFGPQYIHLYNQATATLDDSLRTELAHEMQMIDYNYGGYIIPYFPPVIDGYSEKLGGVVPGLTGLSLSNYGFQSDVQVLSSAPARAWHRVARCERSGWPVPGTAGRVPTNYALHFRGPRGQPCQAHRRGRRGGASDRSRRDVLPVAERSQRAWLPPREGAPAAAPGTSRSPGDPREVIRHALPDYYAQAVEEASLDTISAPEIDITSGEDAGALAFDAVVEIRPKVSIAGYQGLVVTVPPTEPTELEIDARIDRLREQFAR